MLNVYTMSSGKFTVNVVLPKRTVNGATSYTKHPDDVQTAPGRFSAMMASVRHLLRGKREPRIYAPHSVNQFLVDQYNDAVLQLDDHKGFKDLDLFQIRKLTIQRLRRATVREHIQFLLLPFLDTAEIKQQAGWRPQALTVPVQTAP